MKEMTFKGMIQKKLLSFWLTVAMVVTLLPGMGVTAYAEPAPDPTYVCQIGDNKYESLSEALGDVKEGETISLISDITADEGITIGGIENITLDLKGHNVTCATDEQIDGVFRVVSSTVTITDSSDVPGTIKLNSTCQTENLVSGAIWVNGEYNTGCTIEKVNIESESSKETGGMLYGVWVTNGAKCTIKSGNIKVKAYQSEASGVIFDRGAGSITDSIEGGTITSENQSGGKNNVYAIKLVGSNSVGPVSLNISGGQFKATNNSNAGSGDGNVANALCSGENTSVNISDGYFYAKSAKESSEAAVNLGSTYSVTGGYYSDPISSTELTLAEGYVKKENKNAATKGDYKWKVVSSTSADDEDTTWPNTNHPQLTSANEIMNSKAGTKQNPKVLTIQEADGDTGLVDVSYIKGVAKKFTIKPDTASSNSIITVNAGTKYYLDGKYSVVSVNAAGTSYSQAKDMKKYAALKYSSKLSTSLVSLKKGSKLGDQYTVILKKADGNDTVTLIVNNLSFAKEDAKRTYDSKKSVSVNVALKYISGKEQSVDHRTAAITWKVGKNTVPMQGSEPLKIGKSGKEFATVYIDDETGEAVVTTLGNGNKGTVSLKATVNGKKYSTKVKIK